MTYWERFGSRRLASPQANRPGITTRRRAGDGGTGGVQQVVEHVVGEHRHDHRAVGIGPCDDDQTRATLLPHSGNSGATRGPKPAQRCQRSTGLQPRNSGWPLVIDGYLGSRQVPNPFHDLWEPVPGTACRDTLMTDTPNTTALRCALDGIEELAGLPTRELAGGDGDSDEVLYRASGRLPADVLPLPRAGATGSPGARPDRLRRECDRPARGADYSRLSVSVARTAARRYVGLMRATVERWSRKRIPQRNWLAAGSRQPVRGSQPK